MEKAPLQEPGPLPKGYTKMYSNTTTDTEKVNPNSTSVPIPDLFKKKKENKFKRTMNRFMNPYQGRGFAYLKETFLKDPHKIHEDKPFDDLRMSVSHYSRIYDYSLPNGSGDVYKERLKLHEEIRDEFTGDAAKIVDEIWNNLQQAPANKQLEAFSSGARWDARGSTPTGTRIRRWISSYFRIDLVGHMIRTHYELARLYESPGPIAFRNLWLTKMTDEQWEREKRKAGYDWRAYPYYYGGYWIITQERISRGSKKLRHYGDIHQTLFTITFTREGKNISTNRNGRFSRRNLDMELDGEKLTYKEVRIVGNEKVMQIFSRVTNKFSFSDMRGVTQEEVDERDRAYLEALEEELKKSGEKYSIVDIYEREMPVSPSSTIEKTHEDTIVKEAMKDVQSEAFKRFWQGKPPNKPLGR